MTTYRAILHLLRPAGVLLCLLAIFSIPGTEFGDLKSLGSSSSFAGIHRLRQVPWTA